MVRITGNLLKEFAGIALSKQKAVKDALINELSNNTPIDTGYAADQWHLDAAGNIVNTADYIDELNAGSSKQAPAYFIEQTLLAHKGIRPNGTIVRPMP